MPVPVANAGDSVPALNFKPARDALAEGARVTVIVYVFVVVPSCAVTTVVIVFSPTLKGIAAEAVPELTVVPFIFTAAFASDVAGVIFMLVVALGTFAV